MKYLTSILMLMTTLSSIAQTGKAATIQKTFSRTTTISENVAADASVVWALLTNASDYSRWNSTIVAIEGEIQDGGRIRLKSTLDPNRTFKLKVMEFVPEEKLVWGDALGKRTYLLTTNGTGTTVQMTEKIGGPMFPLFANKIPSFEEAFEQFMADLKKESEIISHSK